MQSANNDQMITHKFEPEKVESTKGPILKVLKNREHDRPNNHQEPKSSQTRIWIKVKQKVFLNLIKNGS